MPTGVIHNWQSDSTNNGPADAPEPVDWDKGRRGRGGSLATTATVAKELHRTNELNRARPALDEHCSPGSLSQMGGFLLLFGVLVIVSSDAEARTWWGTETERGVEEQCCHLAALSFSLNRPKITQLGGR